MPRSNANLTTTLRALCAAAKDPNLSDRELVAQFVHQHDQAAFTALVSRHASIVWSVCRRVLGQQADVEDAVQATFILLSRKAGGLKNPELVGAWLHAVARNVALKAKSRKSEDRVVSLVQDIPQTQDPLDALSGREMLAILDEELARLPEKYRAVLLLCCIEGQSREEAAQRLGWSEDSVKGRLERGRNLLSRRLSRRGLTLNAALGASLVWQTASVKAAVLPIVNVLESASPQAVALANAVAASLGTGMWVKVGLVGVLLLTGTGVGVELWSYWQTEHSPRAQQAPAALLNQVAPKQPQADAGADHPPAPEWRPQADPPAADPLKRGETVSALLRRVDVDWQQVTLRIREADVTYPLATGVDIRIDDLAAAIPALAALGGKTRVKATLNPEGTEIVSLTVEGEVVTGTLQMVNFERNTITLRRSATDPKALATTWPLSASVVITLDGQPVTLAAIREGSPVSVRLSADGKRVLALDAQSQ